MGRALVGASLGVLWFSKVRAPLACCFAAFGRQRPDDLFFLTRIGFTAWSDRRGYTACYRSLRDR